MCKHRTSIVSPLPTELHAQSWKGREGGLKFHLEPFRGRIPVQWPGGGQSVFSARAHKSHVTKCTQAIRGCNLWLSKKKEEKSDYEIIYMNVLLEYDYDSLFNSRIYVGKWRDGACFIASLLQFAEQVTQSLLILITILARLS